MSVDCALALESCPRCGKALHGPSTLEGGPSWELPTYQVRWQGKLEEEALVMCEDCLNVLHKRKLVRQCETCRRWMWTGYLYRCPRCGDLTCDECSGAHDWEGD